MEEQLQHHHADDLYRNNEDDDEEEEIIEEEDNDNIEDGRGSSSHNNNNNRNRNGNKKSSSSEEGTESFSGGTTTMTDASTTTTLRALCRKIPRSTSSSSSSQKKKMKKTKDNRKKGVSFHEGGDEVHLFKKDEDDDDEEGTTSVVDEEGVAHTFATSTTSASTTTTTAAIMPSGPQVTVDEHGTIVIAPDSLLPNPENRQSTSDIDHELLLGGANSVIDEGETPSQLGAIQARYDSFTTSPRTVPVRWSVRETKDFYNALRQCGTDFSLMQMYCVGRTRDQLKRKFKVESRKNARLVDMALDPKCHVKLGKLLCLLIELSSKLFGISTFILQTFLPHISPFIVHEFLV
jgi:transcription factor TFIIIB component B''